LLCAAFRVPYGVTRMSLDSPARPFTLCSGRARTRWTRGTPLAPFRNIDAANVRSLALSFRCLHLSLSGWRSLSGAQDSMSLA